MSEPANGGDAGLLPALAALLQGAKERVERLASDPLTARLLDIFAKVPLEDREILITLLEREIQAKLLTDATAAPMTGLSLRPNPRARIYVRVVDSEPAMENEKIILASTRAMRLVAQVVTSMRERWSAATLETLRRLDPTERAGVVAFCRDVISLAEQAERKA